MVVDGAGGRGRVTGVVGGVESVTGSVGGGPPPPLTPTVVVVLGGSVVVVVLGGVEVVVVLGGVVDVVVVLGAVEVVVLLGVVVLVVLVLVVVTNGVAADTTVVAQPATHMSAPSAPHAYQAARHRTRDRSGSGLADAAAAVSSILPTSCSELPLMPATGAARACVGCRRALFYARAEAGVNQLSSGSIADRFGVHMATARGAPVRALAKR